MVIPFGRTLFGLIAALALSSVASAQDEEFQEAVKLLRMGQKEEALAKLQEVLQSNPSNEAALRLYRNTDQDIWYMLVLEEGEIGMIAQSLLDRAKMEAERPSGEVREQMIASLHAFVARIPEMVVAGAMLHQAMPGATPESLPVLASLVGYAIRYYQDFVKPKKRFRSPTPAERLALEDLLDQLEGLPADADGEAIPTLVYEVGKRHDFETLRDWFKALYEILLGQEQGPRMGSFMALYGLEESKDLLRGALAEGVVS